MASVGAAGKEPCPVLMDEEAESEKAGALGSAALPCQIWGGEKKQTPRIEVPGLEVDIYGRVRSWTGLGAAQGAAVPLDGVFQSRGEVDECRSTSDSAFVSEVPGGCFVRSRLCVAFLGNAASRSGERLLSVSLKSSSKEIQTENVRIRELNVKVTKITFYLPDSRALRPKNMKQTDKTLQVDKALKLKSNAKLK